VCTRDVAERVDHGSDYTSGCDGLDGQVDVAGKQDIDDLDSGARNSQEERSHQLGKCLDTTDAGDSRHLWSSTLRPSRRGGAIALASNSSLEQV
jgi:hypothetical protein